MVCQSSFGRDKSNTITIAMLLKKNEREDVVITFMIISHVLSGVGAKAGLFKAQYLKIFLIHHNFLTHHRPAMRAESFIILLSASIAGL